MSHARPSLLTAEAIVTVEGMRRPGVPAALEGAPALCQIETVGGGNQPSELLDTPAPPGAA